MRISSLLRTATVALSLTAGAGSLTAALATDAHAAQQAQSQASNASPYDGQDFVVPESNLSY